MTTLCPLNSEHATNMTVDMKIRDSNQQPTEYRYTYYALIYVFIT